MSRGGEIVERRRFPIGPSIEMEITKLPEKSVAADTVLTKT